MDRNLGNSTKIRDKTMLPTLTNLFNTEVEVVAGTVRELKQIKWLQIGKKEVKVLLLTDDMIININNSKKFYQRTRTTDEHSGSRGPEKGKSFEM